MKLEEELNRNPHTRFNMLTGEWVLVSPHRTERPWQGKIESIKSEDIPKYDHNCYLCPGNKRADGILNPNYLNVFVFNNDFSALLETTQVKEFNESDLLIARSQKGICKVISFSPNHSLTIPDMSIEEINNVVNCWQEEFNTISENKFIKYIQIFENKGEIMGCSNSHPHGQIWAQSDIPTEIYKEGINQKKYFLKNKESLLSAYLKLELKKKIRIIFENDHFAVLTPFWAVWPYEAIIISKQHITSIKFFDYNQKMALSEAIKILTTKYDNLFETSFPYSAGMHQAPINSGEFNEWHWHMHFYPPLLRSATIKKFMVGYEMLANPQRDITPELASDRLRQTSYKHYKKLI